MGCGLKVPAGVSGEGRAQAILEALGDARSRKEKVFLCYSCFSLGSGDTPCSFL